MKIRRGTPLDAKEIKSAHYHAYQVSYRGYLPDDFLDHMPFDENVINRTENYIKEHEYYVAEIDNHVIGFVNLEYPEEKTVEIMALYIHPDFQRQGAGSALVNEVCRRKKEEGYSKLVLWTMKDGPSLGFYQKQGLMFSNTAEKYWKLNIPIIRMEKDL
ncbi:MAG: GNAT family N-acetyltransferase [Alphaproteobacteria bacterium]|nr:GNAT family N-acetyltransferase [Alphaproteobacteria bacterium]